MSYPIQRWDVLSGYNVSKVPAIYIMPDIPFMDFIRANDYKLVCQINNTNSSYDGLYYEGSVSLSSDMPNCRPNFFAKTGLYIITLNGQWMGYPCESSLGVVTIFGRNKSTLFSCDGPAGGGPIPQPDVPSPKPSSPRSSSPRPSSPKPSSPRKPRSSSPRPVNESYNRRKKNLKLNGTGRENRHFCSVM